MIGSEKCEDTDVKDESSSLSPNSFFILFVLSGGVSTIALTLYTISAHKSCVQQNAIWRLMLAVIKRWRNHNRGFSRRVSDLPQTELKNCPKATNLQIQVQKNLHRFAQMINKFAQIDDIQKLILFFEKLQRSNLHTPMICSNIFDIYAY